MKLDQLKISTRNRFEVLSVPDQDEFEGSSEDEKLESVQMEEKSQTDKIEPNIAKKKRKFKPELDKCLADEMQVPDLSEISQDEVKKQGDVVFKPEDNW